jgi:amidase
VAVKQMADEGFDFIPYTPLFNATGQPMSAPLHWTAEGLPLGLRFVGRFGDEPTPPFRLAGQLEQTQPGAHRRPPLLRGCSALPRIQGGSH